MESTLLPPPPSSPPSLTSSIAVRTLLLLPLTGIVWQLLRYVYNLYFHPLARFPGPLRTRASCLPAIRHTLNGDFLWWVNDLHQKYGDVVRVTPNELSFSGADAYRDIYGHKKANQVTLPKDPKFYAGVPGEAHDIVTCSADDHARMRRIFSHAFSDRALKLQEPLFLTYVNNLLRNIRHGCTADPSHKFNMVQMYAYTTFDVMSDLSFGEPLNLLVDPEYRPWVASVFSAFKFGAYIGCVRYFPAWEGLLMKWLVPASTLELRANHHRHSAARVDRRVAKAEARPDIWGLILDRGETLEAGGLTRDEMYSNANLFMLAGTETTATLLSGVTYLLLRHPDAMARLTAEIRGAFAHEDEINIERLPKLRYLHACLEEALRMYPPVPASMPRVTPLPVVIDGHEVPAGVSVGVTTLAALRNPNSFTRAGEFLPERWLPDSPLYTADNHAAFQPFLTGPRGCLGKNMAYHEMRLVMAKMLFNFDITLCPESEKWIDQKIFLTWLKGELNCQFTPVKR